MQITVYKDVKNTTEPHYVNVKFILDRIKSDYYKNKIHEIRGCKDDYNKRTLKASLPSVCFSGRFKKRTDADIIKHSGLVILDFDHVANLKGFKASICADKYTYAAFISPSGDGLKVLIKIPAIIKDHEFHYMALIKKYPTLDATSRNLSRVCFVSYDSELYFNPDSEIFTDKVDKVKKETKIVIPCNDNILNDHKKIGIACDIIRSSTDGNKHHNLIKASRLMGGFIGGGLVSEMEGVRTLELEINMKSPSDFKAACKAIRAGIEYGKKDPIHEKNYKERSQTIINTEIIIENEPAKDVIYLDSVKDKIIYTYHNGSSRGETTHFNKIDEHWRWKRGELTLMHGIGNHGKSTMIYQLALIKAVKEGCRFGVFSPENMPEEEFYKDLIHAYIGKSTENFHDNQMSLEELKRGMAFINEHFYLIYPQDEAPTPDYINTRFRELLIKHKIDGCIIDPYNQLDNDVMKFGGRDDQYLSKYLTNCKRFAIEMNLFYIIIAHPKGNLQKINGNYECPDVYNLSGGAMWNNKIDNILVTHRPNYSVDKEDTTVLFRSQKIKKQKLNGIPGDVEMDYDRRTGRYYINESNPLEGLRYDRIFKDIDSTIEPSKEFHTGILEEAPF